VLTICLGKSTYAVADHRQRDPFEPEWEGYVTLEFSNTTPLPAKIYAGEGCAQVLFFESDEVCETSYKDRGGKYQGQQGSRCRKLDPLRPAAAPGAHSGPAEPDPRRRAGGGVSEYQVESGNAALLSGEVSETACGGKADGKATTSRTIAGTRWRRVRGRSIGIGSVVVALVAG